MEKYHLTTFGCQLNKSDSERIKAKLEKIGLQPVSSPSEADLVVLNMCSVRQSAVNRVYGRAQKLRKLRKKGAKTLLTGCILPQDKKKLKKEFDYILHIKTLPYWQEALKNKKFYYHPDPRGPHFNDRYGLDYFSVNPKFENELSVYIPIATGCDNFCTYCVVPYVRGPFKCRPFKNILEETKKVIKKGAKEVWFVSSNVNSYQYKGKDFSDLLKKANEIEGEFWINFTSSHPKDFGDKLIETIKKSEKVSEYISLPVQSGSDKILKKMNRPYTADEYKKTALKIKKNLPRVHLSTDIIVGFPGETRRDFKKTKKLFKRIGFDMAYIAEYSPRPKTKAAQMKDNVSKKEKVRRREVLTKVLKKNALRKNKKMVGKTFPVLIFSSRKNALIGKTKNYKTVKIPNLKKEEIKNLLYKKIKVKITGAIPWGLEGKLID